jgi:hypothetical protein
MRISLGQSEDQNGQGEAAVDAGTFSRKRALIDAETNSR